MQLIEQVADDTRKQITFHHENVHFIRKLI